MTAAPAGMPQALSRKSRDTLAGLGLGALGGILLGAAGLGVAALAGATLGAGLIAGVLVGGAALGALIGGLVGASRSKDQKTEPAPVAEERITAAQAAQLTMEADWKDIAAAAKAMREARELQLAERLYKLAILKVAGGVNPPSGVPRVAPTMADILIDFSLAPKTRFSGSADAETHGSRVPEHPDNYWRWIDFGPGAVAETEAHTESVITHELVHVRQFLGLWRSYQESPAETRGTWQEFLIPQDPETLGIRTRIAIGAEELEAHITILDYLTRLAPGEARSGLESLFVAYVQTAEFTPPQGTPVPITPETAAPAIRSAFERSDARMKSRMGENLWRSLIRINPPAATWVRVIRELKPIADYGYRDETFRGFYDRFLEDRGLRYADI